MNIINNKFMIFLDIYIEAIRSSLKRPTVFLKRRSNEILNNAYNSKILNLHRANMDIQFIRDPYACVAYMINYINKSNRGMSEILRDAVTEINDGNISLRKKFHRISMSKI